jgi:hypothetical protein
MNVLFFVALTYGLAAIRALLYQCGYNEIEMDKTPEATATGGELEAGIALLAPAGNVRGLGDQCVALAQSRYRCIGVVDCRSARVLDLVGCGQGPVAGGAGAVVRGPAEDKLRQARIHLWQLGADRNSVVGGAGRNDVVRIGAFEITAVEADVDAVT